MTPLSAPLILEVLIPVALSISSVTTGNPRLSVTRSQFITGVPFLGMPPVLGACRRSCMSVKLRVETLSVATTPSSSRRLATRSPFPVPS